jgi:hypothetical protein
MNLDAYNSQQKKAIDIIIKANSYYKESLQQRINSLSDSEYLQFLELKFGGPFINLHYNSAVGGDRMNVFLHDYSNKYSEYLLPLKFDKKPIKILEVGIYKGAGLALWSMYFNNKEIYGFDYDLGNFENNKINLIDLGAFKDGLPITKFYDQFADNSETLKRTFGNKKLDLVIDDAFHSDESIINTFDELQPYLAEKFVYFIEDNRTAWKKLKLKYPNYDYDYNSDELTVVTKRII